MRRDWENYAPKTVALIKATTTVSVKQNVAEILDEHAASTGVSSHDVEAVILSHMHFDHVGDMTTFPPSTDLVVGPGYLEATTPAYPTDPDAMTLDSDTSGRQVRQVDFTPGRAGSCKFGSFDAWDYFGDGSFYILDAPGHSTAHICAAARVTPDTFVFMGADACHHVGVIRPSPWLPLPHELRLPDPVGVCPGELLLAIHPHHTPDHPFLEPGARMFPDYAAALRTNRAIQELDATGQVLVVIAHDHTLHPRMPLFPMSINEWKRLDLAAHTRWRFCDDFREDILREQERRRLETPERDSRGSGYADDGP